MSINKILISVLLAAAMLMSFSCKKQEPPKVAVDIQVTAPGLPEIKSFCDGSQTVNLQYAVYEKDKTTVVATGTATLNGGQANLQVLLIDNVEYDFVFWADAFGASSASPYAVDFEQARLTIDYSKSTINDKVTDAFYLSERATASVTAPLSFTLSRPFGQLNVGTDDVDIATSIDFSKATISVSCSVCSVMDLKTGFISDEVLVAFPAVKFPVRASEAFPVSGYEYLSMCNVLVDKRTVRDFLFTINPGVEGAENATFEVPNVPIERNYRTNLYGSFLTSPGTSYTTLEVYF